MENNQLRENPKFGRKIFFLNLPFAYKNEIIEPLRDEEYEVYEIQDYRVVKSVLKENKDAMLYINIDEQMTFKQWFNFIYSFSQDDILKTTLVGLISRKATKSDSEFFAMHLTLGAGIIFLNGASGIILNRLKQILELCGAKGNRKYVRLDCKGMDDISAYIAQNNKLIDISIDNISTVGFACNFKPTFASYFVQNVVFPNISVTLGNKTVICPSVVFKVVGNMAVMLFTKLTVDTKEYIRKFIHETLSKNFAFDARNQIKDLTKYENEVSQEILSKTVHKDFDGDQNYDPLDEEI